MEYFDRDGKYNFVDENNVVVGYNNIQDCCEYYGWFISEERCPYKVEKDLVGKIPDELKDWIFDIKGFKKEKFRGEHEEYSEYVSFRLLDKQTKRKVAYLILFNLHNGYYAHNFSMGVGGILKQSGLL